MRGIPGLRPDTCRQADQPDGAVPSHGRQLPVGPGILRPKRFADFVSATHTIHDQPTILLDHDRAAELVNAAMARKVAPHHVEEDKHTVDWRGACAKSDPINTPDFLELRKYPLVYKANPLTCSCGRHIHHESRPGHEHLPPPVIPGESRYAARAERRE